MGWKGNALFCFLSLPSATRRPEMGTGLARRFSTALNGEWTRSTLSDALGWTVESPESMQLPRVEGGLTFDALPADGRGIHLRRLGWRVGLPDWYRRPQVENGATLDTLWWRVLLNALGWRVESRIGQECKGPE